MLKKAKTECQIIRTIKPNRQKRKSQRGVDQGLQSADLLPSFMFETATLLLIIFFFFWNFYTKHFTGTLSYLLYPAPTPPHQFNYQRALNYCYFWEGYPSPLTLSWP